MISRRRLLAGLTAAPAVAGLAACGGNSTKAATGRDAATYLTGYGTTPRETFPWVGLAKGFFRDVGIDLTVLPGQPSDANLKSLAAGKAQFAAIDYVSAVRGAASFPDYRAIEVVQTTTLLSMVTLVGRGITKPTDLAHRTLGAAPAAATQTLFPAYAKAAGFDPTTDKIVNAPSDQLPSLLASGRVDAIGAYFTDTANAEAAAPGKTAIAFPYGQFITDLYGSVILATTEVLSGKPDLVQRFAAAMARTLQYCVDNPEESGKVVQSQLPTVKGAVVATINARLKQFVGSAAFDHDKVVRSIAVLQAAGLAKAGLAPEKVVDFDLATKAGLH